MAIFYRNDFITGFFIVFFLLIFLLLFVLIVDIESFCLI